MTERNRLGLGTMGMSIVRNPENSVKTIYAPKAAMEAKRKLKKECQFHC